MKTRWLLMSLGLALMIGCGGDRSPILSAEQQTVAVGKKPFRIALGIQPDELLVSCFDSQAIYVLNTKTRTVIQELAVRTGPAKIIPDPVHQKLYVLHLRENTLAILSGHPLKVERLLGTGSMLLAGGALRPGTNELWICDGVEGVHVVVVPEMKMKQKYSLGRYPQQVAFSPDGAQAFVTLKGENAVVVVHPEDGKILARIPVGIYPSDILVTSNTACVSNYGSNNISLIDIVNQKEKCRVAVRRQPNLLTLWGKTLWVSCEDSYRVVAVNVTQAKVIGSLKINFYPGAIQTLPNGSLVIAEPDHQQLVFMTLNLPKTGNE